MVAKITIPKEVIRALNYNEKKMQQGKAECIYAGNYLRNASDMNFHQKLQGLENRNVLNERATTKTLHISLNFDPSEKLTKEKLIAIANAYMDKIGFATQPFLVYQHVDAGHPHLHIVTTTIKDDGKRINTHNIGRNQSEKARKEIEQEYKLVKAENQKQLLHEKAKPLQPEKLLYGKSETKRGITNVLGAVVNHYKYTSLAEFNAVLKQFNVMADRGKEEGRIYKTKGLVYRILDSNGDKTGVPIKASSIYSKPTLDNIEKKFKWNEALCEPHKARLKQVIDDALKTKVDSVKEFAQILSTNDIYTLVRQNNEGRMYGITFVDNKTKTVFNGSDLGKQYTIAALQSRLTNADKNLVAPSADNNSIDDSKNFSSENRKTIPVLKQATENIKSSRDNNIIEQLFEPKQQFDYIPNQLKKKKRRKKKTFNL